MTRSEESARPEVGDIQGTELELFVDPPDALLTVGRAFGMIFHLPRDFGTSRLYLEARSPGGVFGPFTSALQVDENPVQVSAEQLELTVLVVPTVPGSWTLQGRLVNDATGAAVVSNQVPIVAVKRTPSGGLKDPESLPKGAPVGSLELETDPADEIPPG